jgi:hypothetical protein
MNYLISDGIVMMRKALRRKEQLIVMRVEVENAINW